MITLNCQAHERAQTCTGLEVLFSSKREFTALQQFRHSHPCFRRPLWVDVYANIVTLYRETIIYILISISYLIPILCVLGYCSRLDWKANRINFILDGFNLIWCYLMIISDIACICYIFYIICKNGGRGKLLFLLERLERADMVIWISQLSTQTARMCAISDQLQFYPNVTFQENLHCSSSMSLLLNPNYVR